MHPYYYHILSRNPQNLNEEIVNHGETTDQQEATKYQALVATHYPEARVWIYTSKYQPTFAHLPTSDLLINV